MVIVGGGVVTKTKLNTKENDNSNNSKVVSSGRNHFQPINILRRRNRSKPVGEELRNNSNLNVVGGIDENWHLISEYNGITVHELQNSSPSAAGTFCARCYVQVILLL